MDFEDFKGKTFKAVTNVYGKDCLLFETDSGELYYMFHKQDCCESVWLEDVTGDLEDIVGSKILLAEERTESGGVQGEDTWTATFYELRTRKASITLRWMGESNGYYSEEVDLVGPVFTDGREQVLSPGEIRSLIRFGSIPLEVIEKSKKILDEWYDSMGREAK